MFATLHPNFHYQMFFAPGEKAHNTPRMEDRGKKPSTDNKSPFSPPPRHLNHDTFLQTPQIHTLTTCPHNPLNTGPSTAGRTKLFTTCALCARHTTGCPGL